MKRITSVKIRLFAAAFAALVPLATAQAGSFFSDFNSGLPAGMTLYNAANIQSSGGYTNSGYLQFTTAASGGVAAAILGDLDSGTPIVSFTAQYKVLIGHLGGSSADGMSFNFAADLPAGAFTEEGAGTGYTVEFDTFPNGAPDTAPTIDVKIGAANGDHGTYTGNEFASTADAGLAPDTFVDCVIQLNPNNTLTVCYDGVYVYSNLDLIASGYSPVGGSTFGIGARTGGVTEDAFLDNLNIATYTNGTPFVNSFLPQGRAVATNSPIDIVLTDFNTHVNTNAISSIVLKINGTTVSPTITTNGSGDGNTYIHYVKPGGFRLASHNSVNLTYSDDASPTPQQFTWQYEFNVVLPPFIPGAYVTIFSEGFESYNSGNAPLDKNYSATSPNNAAPNGSGNPWWGPAPPNARVVGTTGGVSPHGGTNMITASAPSDLDEQRFNIEYRLRGGQPLVGNFSLDWWFYDPVGPGHSDYGDAVALGNYTVGFPTGTDYPDNGSFSGGSFQQILALGADGANQSAGFDNTKYQTRIIGGVGYNNGNNNTSTTRSIGWHNARIIAGSVTNGTAQMYFYIDDFVVPTYSANSGRTGGFQYIEIELGYKNTLGYFDDLTLALAVPPNLNPTRSGNILTFSFPGGFTLQSALNVTGPYTDVSTTSGYTYDVTSNPQQFFRLKN